MTDIVKKANKSVNLTAGTVTWAWESGAKTTVSLEDFDEAIITAAGLNGLSQKLGDSYAGTKTVAEAIAAFNEVLDSLTRGEWNRKGGGSGGRWVEAIAEAAGVDLAKAQARWSASDDKQKKAIRNHPDVKLAKARLDLEAIEKTAGDGEAFTL